MDAADWEADMLSVHERKDEGEPAGKQGSLISLRGASKTYLLGKGMTVDALKATDLEVARGGFIVITGRSGSGKTTLLNVTAGLTRPTSGQVFAEGVDIWTMSDREQARLRNRKLGFVFQFPSLMPSLTSLENVVLPTMFGQAEGRADARERAESLLREVGLAEKMHAYPRQLSAGQQKRVVIARSMINRPEILIADEPTGDLDEQTEREFMTLLQQIHQVGRLTILFVTHNRNLVPYATRHVELASGAIVSDGS